MGGSVCQPGQMSLDLLLSPLLETSGSGRIHFFSILFSILLAPPREDVW